MAPIETLTIAAGFPFQEFFPYGREPTSIAFFKTPGTERLYSGVRNKIPSTALIFSFNATHSFGGFASRSSLNIGRQDMFNSSIDKDSGAIAINALAVFRLKDSLRRHPTITAILCFFICT